MQDRRRYLLEELRQLIQELGQGGGIMSPSVYDTAQVLRFLPPDEGDDGVTPVIEWLLAQQQGDGGWGDPSAALTRDIPTLAALLALHDMRGRGRTAIAVIDGAVASALDFLGARRDLWQGCLPDDIPVAAELIIPKLLDEIHAAGLNLNDAQYLSLRALGRKRKALIAELAPEAGSPAVFSWEAWGDDPSVRYVDDLGSVGHSPAATAAWLRAAKRADAPAPVIARAESYLRQAMAATGSGIAGVYPTAWPIDRFEQAFGGYALLIAGLINEPSLHDEVDALVRQLQTCIQEYRGVGFTDYFWPDGDNTAAAVGMINAFTRQTAGDALEPFRRETHFLTYPFELQPSISVTARAVHALADCACDVDVWQRQLVERAEYPGHWSGDKWNTSWLYTTCHVLHALKGVRHAAVVTAGLEAISAAQNDDGGWGSDGVSNLPETAYALLAFMTCPQARQRFGSIIQQGHGRLQALFADITRPARHTYIWLNKEHYQPFRVDKMFALAALLAVDDFLQEQIAGQDPSIAYTPMSL